MLRQSHHDIGPYRKLIQIATIMLANITVGDFLLSRLPPPSSASSVSSIATGTRLPSVALAALMHLISVTGSGTLARASGPQTSGLQTTMNGQARLPVSS